MYSSSKSSKTKYGSIGDTNPKKPGKGIKFDCLRLIWRLVKVGMLIILGVFFGLIIFLAIMKHIDNKSEFASIAEKWNDNILNSNVNDYDNEYVDNTFTIYVIMSEARQEYIKDVISNSLNWDKNDKVTYIEAYDYHEFSGEFAMETLVKSGIISSDAFDSSKTSSKDYYPGRVACVLSHKKALEQFLSDTEDDDDSGIIRTALILEDDIQINPLLDYSPDIYINAIMDKIGNTEWNFINFGRCYDWCYSDDYLSDSDMFVVDSLNPLCTHMYAVTRDGAKEIVNNLFPLKRLNIDQIITRMIRESKLTGYASSIPVLLQNKKETGSLSAPNVEYPYRMCATWYNEIFSKIFDTNMLSSILSSDGHGLLSSDAYGVLSSDALLSDDGYGYNNVVQSLFVQLLQRLSKTGVISSDGYGLLASDFYGLLSSDGYGGLLSSDAFGSGLLSSDANGLLSSDANGLLSSDANGLTSNFLLLRMVNYLLDNNDKKGDLYL